MKIFHSEQAVDFNKKGNIEKSDSDVYLGKATDPWRRGKSVNNAAFMSIT